ncbi:MAG: hypothetical protein U0793_25255 [Gemmataceae bacterium]
MKRFGVALACFCLGLSALTGAVLPGKAKDSGPSKDIPLAEIDSKHRAIAEQILNKPSFSARGPSEVFNGKPEQYLWLLDNPHRAVLAWRKLGAKCVSISSKGGGEFSWSDDMGSEVIWETVFKSGSMRIWLAEGKVRPNSLMPLVPVKVLVVLRHHEASMPDGTTALHHQADVFVHTDAKTAHMLLRMLGPAASRMAEDGLGQLQLFFSGLTWYLERHPDEAKDLLREGK